MIACGGGKNGSGRHANFAVAASHNVRNAPRADSQGARRRKASPPRPRRSAPSVPMTAIAAITKAPTPSCWVRDQSPTSSHSRQDRPNAVQGAPAASPPPADRSHSRDWKAGARWPATALSTSDREYVDINALREFGGIRRWLDDGDRL